MFLYALVARSGRFVLAEHAVCDVSTSHVYMLLPEDRPRDGTVVVQCANCNVCMLHKNGYTFVVIQEGSDSTAAFAFLALLSDEFVKGGFDIGAARCPRLGLNSRFGPVMEKLLMAHAKKPDMLNKLKAEISEIHSILNANIDLVIARGTKLDYLGDKADELAAEAQVFETKAKKIARNLWWQHHRFKIFMILLLLISVTVVVLLTVVEPRSHHQSAPVIEVAPTPATPAARQLLSGGS